MRGLRITAALLIAALSVAPAGAGEPALVGIWLHENRRIKVQIAPCGEALCGHIIWFRWPNDADGVPLVDLKNPAPSLRSRPLLGLRVLHGLRRKGPRKWTGGRIYNPDDGREYHVEMSMRDNGNAHVRAYVLLPLFGKTFVWTRVP